MHNDEYIEFIKFSSEYLPPTHSLDTIEVNLESTTCRISRSKTISLIHNVLGSETSYKHGQVSWQDNIRFASFYASLDIDHNTLQDKLALYLSPKQRNDLFFKKAQEFAFVHRNVFYSYSLEKKSARMIPLSYNPRHCNMRVISNMPTFLLCDYEMYKQELLSYLIYCTQYNILPNIYYNSHQLFSDIPSVSNTSQKDADIAYFYIKTSMPSVKQVQHLITDSAISLEKLLENLQPISLRSSYKECQSIKIIKVSTLKSILRSCSQIRPVEKSTLKSILRSCSQIRPVEKSPMKSFLHACSQVRPLEKMFDSLPLPVQDCPQQSEQISDINLQAQTLAQRRSMQQRRNSTSQINLETSHYQNDDEMTRLSPPSAKELTSIVQHNSTHPMIEPFSTVHNFSMPSLYTNPSTAASRTFRPNKKTPTKSKSTPVIVANRAGTPCPLPVLPPIRGQGIIKQSQLALNYDIQNDTSNDMPPLRPLTRRSSVYHLTESYAPLPPHLHDEQCDNSISMITLVGGINDSLSNKRHPLLQAPTALPEAIIREVSSASEKSYDSHEQSSSSASSLNDEDTSLSQSSHLTRISANNSVSQVQHTALLKE